ncbi:hypothetical protein [Algiphilus aromaticivorans]|uniref:hypothetical protein n=1 Tax=Algiphilus aromaticivorans TaxID=382454 RepID=UPI0005C1F4D2|nr:hypothetical protein [Algiphilus aromaticivorans]
MIGYAVSGLLMLVGMINLIPAVGVLATERLRTLYGIAPEAPELLLLRHRALLFALLGSFVVLAAFRPQLQPLAFIAALVSMGGFLLLAATGGAHGEAIARIVRADLLGLALLAAAFALYALDSLPSA